LPTSMLTVTSGWMAQNSTSLRLSTIDLARSTFAVPLIIVAIHMATLALPFVNQEGAFNSATLFFFNGDEAAIRAFFAADANTVAVSAIGALITATLGLNPEYGCRLVSILCAGLLAASIPGMLAPKTRQSDVATLQALILFSPLIWTYSGRGTADFAPVAFAVAAIALFWNARPTIWSIGGATLLFAIAAVTKYHAALLLPFVPLGPNSNQSLKLRAFLFVIAGSAAVIALLIYNLIIFQRFGFWITSPQFLVQLSPTSAHIFNNFVRCTGYLALLSLPFSVQAAFRRSATPLAIKVSVVAAAFALGLLMPPSAGELGFGPLDRWISEVLSGAVLAAAMAVLLLAFLDAWRDRVDRSTILTILVFIAVLSVSRPAQRYLMFVMPFLYLHIAKRVPIGRFAIPALAAFLLFDVFIAINQFDFMRSVRVQ
jgi:hypothetical protein